MLQLHLEPLQQSAGEHPNKCSSKNDCDLHLSYEEHNPQLTNIYFL